MVMWKRLRKRFGKWAWLILVLWGGREAIGIWGDVEFLTADGRWDWFPTVSLWILRALLIIAAIVIVMGLRPRKRKALDEVPVTSGDSSSSRETGPPESRRVSEKARTDRAVEPLANHYPAKGVMVLTLEHAQTYSEQVFCIVRGPGPVEDRRQAKAKWRGLLLEARYPDDFENARPLRNGRYGVEWVARSRWLPQYTGGRWLTDDEFDWPPAGESAASDSESMPVFTIRSDSRLLSGREVGERCLKLQRAIDRYLTKIQTKAGTVYGGQAVFALAQKRIDAANKYRTDWAAEVLFLRDEIVRLGHDPGDLDEVLDQGVAALGEMARVALILGKWGHSLMGRSGDN
jgi:hypothetical protein